MIAVRLVWVGVCVTAAACGCGTMGGVSGVRVTPTPPIPAESARMEAGNSNGGGGEEEDTFESRSEETRIV